MSKLILRNFQSPGDIVMREFESPTDITSATSSASGSHRRVSSNRSVEPYWLLVSGGKRDYTIKWWIPIGISGSWITFELL